MTYTVSINSRGVMTVPKVIRDEIQTSKVLLIKNGENYIIQPIKKISQLGGSLVPKKQLTDKEIEQLKRKSFLQANNKI